MNTHRTGGMTAIGIMNIIFGSIGSLMSLFLVIGGGIFAAAGSAGMAAEGQTGNGSGAGGMMAAGGMLLVGLGLLMLLCNAMLAISGIGVLKMASWGRLLSMICGASMALLGILTMMNGDFGFMTLCMVGYGCVLVGLFMKADWKAAFTGGRASTSDDMMQTSGSASPDQMRHAA